MPAAGVYSDESSVDGEMLTIDVGDAGPGIEKQLLSSVHPVQADFRIQMDVNFVFIERHLVPGQSLYQLANFP